MELPAWPQVHCAAAADCWVAEFVCKESVKLLSGYEALGGINFRRIRAARQAEKSPAAWL